MTIIAKAVYAQDSTFTQSIRGDFSANFYGTNTQMPFWFKSNQYNVIPQKNAISLSGTIDFEKDLVIKTAPLRFVGSAQVVGNILDDRKKTLFLPQLYAGLRYGPLLMYIGRKKEQFGLTDTTLTSGSYIWSGNALPLPKIQIEISDYLPIGIKSPWIAFKGNYAHGWFGESEFAYGYFLHQKSIVFPTH